MNSLISLVFQGLYFENLRNNFVFSPASYQEAIHSLGLCVKDKNLEEIRAALELSDTELLTYIKEYKKDIELENNNYLLYAQEYSGRLNETVTNQLKELSVELQSTDFNSPDSVINYVNKLVVENTHGKISNLLSRQDLSPFTKFIILNCVYFKKEWAYEFDERRTPEIFYGAEKETQIKFLNKQAWFRYYEDASLDIVEIPYKQTDVCCYLFVPKNGLLELTNNFRESYNKINSVKEDCEVNLTVPPFKIETTLNLENLTKLAGIKNVFEWNKDWSLVNFDTLMPEAVLKVDRIIQKAYIDFTKTGTEAAAATAIIINMSGCFIHFNFIPPKIKYIRADKPFLYVLANKNKKENPLFIGVVNQLDNWS